MATCPTIGFLRNRVFVRERSSHVPNVGLRNQYCKECHEQEHQRDLRLCLTHLNAPNIGDLKDKIFITYFIYLFNLSVIIILWSLKKLFSTTSASVVVINV